MLAARIVRFNPRPREGGDAEQKPPVIAYRVVSIHAPVKGATSERRTEF